ncbi:SLAP domain-containing protein [Companilactobacillus farciminis]|uniref:SLAP domain-containing protein n=1 Tax=Companilactobacillus farciminis TaxID=1612 RepID=UPI0034D3F377
MRFQQLNRDPNSIMRKKLVKSKKNWIVVSSLSFAGGLLLLGGPTEIVHAADTTVAPTEQVATPTSSDSKTDTTKTDSTKSADVTKAVAPVTTEENTDSTVQSDTVAPVEKETATTEKTDATDTNAVSETLNKETTTSDVEETGTTSEAQPVVAKDTQTTAESENTEALVSSPDVKDTQTTTEDVKNIDGEKVDTPVPDSDIATDETTDTTQSDVNKENVIQNDGAQDDILAANLAVSKAQLASLGISAEDLTLTPETEVLADGNIAEGTQGTTPWKIDADGVLHLGTPGETTSLADNTATTTQHTSTGSSQVDSSSTETKESPTSPWMKHANDIKRINFEGDVNAASDMSYMFADLNKLTTITNANKLHTVVSNVSMTKTVGMFANDTNLKEISSDSTTNETKPTINLSSWNFASVTDANSMFLNDSSIEYVTFSEYKESTLKSNTNFNYMFKNNTSLITAYMPQLQFRRTKSMIGMFQNDRSLTALDINSWNMANSSSIDTGDSSKGEGMFDGTDSLTSLTLSSINRFSSYTALSSKNGSSWTGGGKSLLSDPSKADNSTTFNLNSIVSNLGSGILNPTEFKTDGNVPADIEANLIIPSNLGDIETSISGPIYSSQDVKVPTKDGYTANVSTITANILNDKAVTNYYVTYTPVHSNGGTATFTLPDKTTSDVEIPAGEYGKTGVSIDVPQVTGYTSNVNKVEVTYNADGSASADTSNITYTPVKSDGGTATFTLPDKTTSDVKIPAGEYGKTGVSIDVPQVTGYTSNVNKVEVTYNADGSASADTSNIVYSPVASNPGQKVTFNVPDGQSKTLNIPDGVYGTDGSITIPDFNGYTHTNTTLPVIYGPDGVAIVNTTDIYSPVKSNSGQTATFTTPDGQSKILDIPAGEYGTNGSITIPDFDGYTHKDTTVPVIYGPNGVAIVNTTDIYSPVKSKSGQTVTFTAPNGQSRTIDIPEGAYGTDGSITVPNIDGYTHDEEVPVSYDKDGNAIVNTDKIYTPIHFDATTTTVETPEGNKTITIPEGNYGDDSKTVDVPSVTGYISAPLTVTYNADGTTSINTPSPLYTPVHSNGGTAKFTTPDEQTQTVNIPAGDFGTNGNISIPDFEGYTHEDKTIPVIYDANGNAIVKTDGLYTPIHFDPTTTTVKTPEGNKTVTIPEGNYGDDPKTVDVPSITGYTSNPLTVTYNADGTTSIDTPNKLYTPVHSDGDKATFITPNGDTTVDIPAGDFSKKDVTIDVPQVTGYNTNVDKVPVTYNADGSASADTKVIYTPVHSDGGTATIETPDGPVTIDIPEGDYSKSNVTTVNVPKVHGYTTSTDTLKVTYDANGNATINTSDVSYTGVENKVTSINLKTPDGIVPLDIPAGHFGDEPVTITAPSISGYTAPSIIVTFGADGIPTIVDAKTPDKEISTSDTLTYSRIPSSHTIIQKDTEKTDIATPKQNSQNVATYSEKGQILLYTLGEDNKMTAISNYGLAKQSTWYSDEQITVDGIQYLRVATNKWVKASQVYSYQDLNQYVRTYDKTVKVLYKSEDEVINNRILQPNTSWFSDRTTYVINGDKYYRVATNEFVSAKDAYIYQPTNMVVKTHTDSSSKNLYTAKGELITNRSLVADSNWLVDSIVYIEGIKYYRVATNEFVKASDVDINH